MAEITVLAVHETKTHLLKKGLFIQKVRFNFEGESKIRIGTFIVHHENETTNSMHFSYGPYCKEVEVYKASMNCEPIYFLSNPTLQIVKTAPTRIELQYK